LISVKKNFKSLQEKQLLHSRDECCQKKFNCAKRFAYTARWLAPSPHSERVPGSTPTWGLSVWSLHVLPVYAWVLSRYSGFLPLSKNMHVRLIGTPIIVLRSVCVVVCIVCLCVALCWTGDPSRVYSASHPIDGLSGYRKWMDGWVC